jgi:C6 transcription factor Pro1
MPKEARSRGACWTCRLRRKKCDEHAPACSACTSLAIPCYGYDPKPAWADGGARQKAKTYELRIIIRELANMRRHGKQQVVGENLDDKDEVLHIRNAASECFDAKTSSGTVRTTPLEVETLATSESDPSSKSITSDFLEYDSHASLLMHYLDVVFPNQFPFYNPSAEEGGRGWLLLIILRTKPLYLAALSMAAYHQQSRRRKFCSSMDPGSVAVDIFQTHHSLAIKELRLYLDTFKQEERAQSLEGNIEVLASIVFLICLEVSNHL